jgi:peroxiredoxin
MRAWKATFFAMVGGAAAIVGALLFIGAARAAMQPGEAAPDFTVQAAVGGKTFVFSLADALKKGPVVLFFYPKSFTPGCTAEAHEFAENAENFQKAGASLIGVSADTIETQKEFSAKECREKFPVGADPDGKLIKAYKAQLISVGDMAMSARISYVIAPDGKILMAYQDMSAEPHIEKTLATVRAWRAAHPN